MQDIDYDYDSVSNITNIANSAPMMPNGLGGTYSQSFSYDNLYRLTGSSGIWAVSDSLDYHTETEYHANGRIKQKQVTAKVLSNGHVSQISYDNGYYYDNLQQPNTLSRISAPEVVIPGISFRNGKDRSSSPVVHFSWDATGNMVSQDPAGDAGRRFLCWDEQNRLQGVVDGKHLSYYLYDANGDRTFKLTGKGDLQNISGTWQYYYLLENATLYASPYLVATDKGYTKHYYAESERIASKIGGGGLTELGIPLYNDDAFIKKMKDNNTMMDKVLKECLNAKYYEVKPVLQQLYDWQDSVHPEDNCYWYHPDHLGSSSWITHTNGHTVQHLHYLPWGEDFINQKLSGFDGVRFTFSAKEKDVETGLSYFGSRYYSSDLSIWLSVDPMAAKYASLSPYVYCANNPVKLVDPDGEEIGWIQDNEGNVFWDENTNSIEDFKCNYDGKTGYSYVSDNDNFRSYTLPNGDGKVLVNEWVEGNVTDGCSTPRIELEFSPSDKNCSSGWIQTYYSNVPDADSHNYGYLLPGSNLENRLDFQTIDKTSTTVPYWNPAKKSTKLQDMPRRAYNEGAARAVIWGAQSSILVNGRRSVTISWGFSINSNNSGTFYSPRIEKKPNTFHLNAIQLMR